ncbi:rod shape-determining protein MreC [candidate division KSB1 bacterium]|nr:rod shape-determining protein MreC [candidate division KSB1 bacterium]
MKKIINDYTLLLLCISVSFLLMIFSRTPGQDTGLEEILFRFFGSINSPFVHLKTLRYVQQENRVLRFENTLLELEKMKYIETFYENKRLRMLLNFKDQDSIAVKPARVLSQSNIAGVKTITIDAGTMSGVRIDMPLVNSDGLIGRIIKTTSRYAIGQLLVDRNFRAAARIQQSREIGIYQNYDQQSGVLFGVHHRADVHIGDDVITMGKSSVFPAGLFIGTVARIDTTTSRLFKRVYVESKVNFTKLEEVFIVFNRTDE